MGENVRVSVVMPAYNAEKTIRMAIDSVLSQTFRNLELIVVDDCSKDATASVVKAYMEQDDRVRLYSNPQNCGVSLTRKYGVEKARGEWIAFLDSDDAWKANKLEKQMALAEENQDAKLIFTGSSFMDAEGEPIHWIMHAPKTIGYRTLLKQNLVSNSSVLILKCVFQQFAVTGNNMHEDFACWLNFLRAGNLAYGIDEPLFIYRLSTTSKSGNKLKAAKMNWNTYRAVGVNWFVAVWSMLCYGVKGLVKYTHIRHAKNTANPKTACK